MRQLLCVFIVIVCVGVAWAAVDGSVKSASTLGIGLPGIGVDYSDPNEQTSAHILGLYANYSDANEPNEPTETSFKAWWIHPHH